MDDEELAAFEHKRDEFEQVPSVVGADDEDLRWIGVGLEVGECDQVVGGCPSGWKCGWSDMADRAFGASFSHVVLE